MTDADVIGWVFESTDGTRWAVQTDTKEKALQIFTSTAPSDSEIIDERTIPSGDARQYELRAGEAVSQKIKGDGRS